MKIPFEFRQFEENENECYLELDYDKMDVYEGPYSKNELHKRVKELKLKHPYIKEYQNPFILMEQPKSGCTKEYS